LAARGSDRTLVTCPRDWRCGCDEQQEDDLACDEQIARCSDKKLMWLRVARRHPKIVDNVGENDGGGREHAGIWARDKQDCCQGI